jgi:hypothetical protein
MKAKEFINKGEKQGVAEGSNNDYRQGVDDGVEYFLYTDGEGDTIKDVFLQMKRSATEPKSEKYWRGVVDGMKSVQSEEQVEQGVAEDSETAKTEDWNKVNKRDKTNGLSQKAVNAYRRENPGSKLKTAVTTKPSKLKPGSKAAKRRKSFCARMGGNKGPMKKPNGKPTPKALALRRWNCESIEQMAQMIEQGEQMISEMKQRLDPKCWTGKHKEGTKIKGGVRVNNCVPNKK